MHLTSASPGFSSEMLAQDLRTVIAVRTFWPVTIFYSIWLFIWIWIVSKMLLQPASLEVMTPGFILLMTLCSLGMLLGLLWQFGGKEIISIERDCLHYRIQVFGLGWSRRYALRKLQFLRVAPVAGGGAQYSFSWWPPVFGAGRGQLVFDYEGKPKRMAASLNAAQCEMLRQELQAHLQPRTPV
ncbi:hypothetical protein V8J88_04645 [Massilia sp. W12]|uniref:hypothetical protein n=1 Tax=Massilia sp. W12 TaxID=3126507 RepID=UPI0030CADD92